MEVINAGLERNRQIKSYIESLFAEEEEEIRFARENSKKEGLKEIQVPALVGKMLYMLAKIQNPKNVLEIGTLGGYSTLWLARALPPDGKIVTLEQEAEHARIAEAHIAHAGFQNQVEVHVGDARLLLPKIDQVFDLIFIDADKENYPLYLDYALKLSRPGTLILSDNLIPKRGEIEHPDPRDVEALAIYDFNQKMAAHPRLESTIFPTIVGEKGRMDSLGVARVKD